MIWEDPPRNQRGKGAESFWDLTIEELKKHPGRWAHHPKRIHKSTATQLKRRFPGLEATCRNIHKDDDGTERSDLYYRWMGVKND